MRFGVGLGAVCGKWVSQSLSMATQKGLKARVCFCVCEREELVQKCMKWEVAF